MENRYKNIVFGHDKPSIGGAYNGMNYPFGFDNKEKDNEIYGEGNGYDFGARIYDARLGRWLSVDPLFNDYLSFSPYHYSSNNPVYYIDLNGQKIFIHYKNYDGTDEYYEYGTKIKSPANPFVIQTIKALDAIAKSPKVSEKLEFLVNSTDYKITINYTEFTTTSTVSAYKEIDKSGKEVYIIKKEQGIIFNPYLGLKETSTGKINAAFICLWHELGHQYDAIKYPSEFFKRTKNKYEKGSKDEVWTDEEEKYNEKNNVWPLVEDTYGFKMQGHKVGGKSGIEKTITKSSTNNEKSEPY